MVARWCVGLRSLPEALRSPTASRMRWGMVDQCASSLTNFAVTVAAARTATEEEFGAFSLAMAVYIFLLWMARSLATEPLVVRYAGAPWGTQRLAAKEAVGLALVVGCASAAGMAAAGALAGGLPGRALLVMALFMPALLVQDAYRYVLVMAGKARGAAANDCAWLLLLALAGVALGVSGNADAIRLAAAFGVSGTVAALLGARQTRVVPSPGSTPGWLRRNRELAVPYVLELVAVNGTTQLAMIGIAVIAGVAAVGHLRAAMLLLSPLTVLFAGVYLVGTPEAVRLGARSLGALARFVTGLAAASALLIVLFAMVVMSTPGRIGSAVLGTTWLPARHLLWPIALMTSASACSLSAVVGLRALRAQRRSLYARAWVAPVTLGFALVGAYVGGAQGAAIGLGIAATVGAAISWAAFRRALSDTEAPADGSGEQGTEGCDGQDEARRARVLSIEDQA